MRGLLPLFVLISGCRQAPDLSGAWVGRFKSQQLGDREVNRYQAWTLQLNKDGTFTEHHEFRIMMDIIEDGKGAYSLSGDKLTLKGTATVKTDDGYVKETKTDSFTNELTVSGRSLIYQVPKPEERKSLATFAAGETVTFWRAGEIPLPPVPPQDPKAEALLKQTEAVYRAMKSYRDEGTYHLKNVPNWRVTYRTRFLKGKGLLFEAALVEDGKTAEHHLVWVNGTQARWASSMFLRSEKGPVEPVLAGLDQSVGIEALLLPHLLMPKAFQRTLDQAYPGATIKRTEVVDGKPCQVLDLTNPDQNLHLVLWIETATGLIRRAATKENDIYAYKPQANVAVKSGEVVGHELAYVKPKPHHMAPHGMEATP